MPNLKSYPNIWNKTMTARTMYPPWRSHTLPHTHMHAHTTHICVFSHAPGSPCKIVVAWKKNSHSHSHTRNQERWQSSLSLVHWFYLTCATLPIRFFCEPARPGLASTGPSQQARNGKSIVSVTVSVSGSASASQLLQPVFPLDEWYLHLLLQVSYRLV